jgi:transposase-like protein
MYYDGLSFGDVARNLASNYNNPVNESTVYRWIITYTTKAVNALASYHPKVGDAWVADETAIKFNNTLYWIWDIIDRDTRFLLASYLSPNRGTAQARILMETASKKAEKIPKVVITDKLKAYLDGIELTFGSETLHIQSSPFQDDNYNNIIERMQGTIRERTKVLRGFKTIPTANTILSGFLIHYNFFRPHITLKNRTPAEVAGIKLPFKTWLEFVRQDK